MLVSQVRQVVAGQAAIERGKGGADEFSLGVPDIQGRAVHLTHATGRRTRCLQRVFVKRQAVQALTPEQDAVQLKHMVARFAIGATALPAGVGIDHATHGRAVRSGQFRREEQAMGLEGGVELILDHTGLHPHPTLLGIDFEDAVHVPRQIHDHAIGQRLAIGACAATARGQLDRLEARLAHQRGDARHIIGVQWEHRSLRQTLVDGIVGGQDGSGTVVGADLATKATVMQGFEECRVVGVRCNGRQLGDHRRTASE